MDAEHTIELVSATKNLIDEANAQNISVPAGYGSELENLMETLQHKVANDEEFRLLVKIILGQDPSEIPEGMRESLKNMVVTLRSLVRQGARK
jgi:hypothetical protein